ncbi:hypothetical protein [Modestobacter sp. VKM Ac-2984]|uniref:hypothetical protein n=1 Tax=Modestobacter sp. VKM Ac-2984 TaxID=3004138 RepID=UPI0022AAEEE1|nr:hypothetical protein [Modestobacter sp. VKM Ac-2984]MCZ2815959.1 hypothetical protein [Modestobacter sp. VKM Ac-2984]
MDRWLGDIFGGWVNVNQGITGGVIGGILAGVASAIAVYFTNRHARGLAKREEARAHVIDAFRECMTSFIGVPDDASRRHDLELIARVRAKLELAAALIAEMDKSFAQELQDVSNELALLTAEWRDESAMQRYNGAWKLVEPLLDAIPNWLGNVKTVGPRAASQSP